MGSPSSSIRPVIPVHRTAGFVLGQMVLSFSMTQAKERLRKKATVGFTMQFDGFVLRVVVGHEGQSGGNLL